MSQRALQAVQHYVLPSNTRNAHYNASEVEDPSAATRSGAVMKFQAYLFGLMLAWFLVSCVSGPGRAANSMELFCSRDQGLVFAVLDEVESKDGRFRDFWVLMSEMRGQIAQQLNSPELRDIWAQRLGVARPDLDGVVFSLSEDLTRLSWSPGQLPSGDMERVASRARWCAQVRLWGLSGMALT